MRALLTPLLLSLPCAANVHSSPWQTRPPLPAAVGAWSPPALAGALRPLERRLADGAAARLKPPFPPGTRAWTPPNGRFGAPRPYGVHQGLDLAVPEGTAVYPLRPGRVLLARRFELLRDWGRGYGGLVVVAHADGSRSLYSHLGEVSVRRGQAVGRRTRLGATGGQANGESSGPHLHLMLFDRRGRPVDPANFLR